MLQDGNRGNVASHSDQIICFPKQIRTIAEKGSNLRTPIISDARVDYDRRFQRQLSRQTDIQCSITYTLLANGGDRLRQEYWAIDRMSCRATLCSSLKSVGKQQLPITMKWLSLTN